MEAALFKAVYKNRLYEVQHLLLKMSEDKSNDINKLNKAGNTVLLVAVKSGQTDVVRELLAYPTINVNLKDKNGDSALHIAVNNLSCLKLLLLDPRVDHSLRDRHCNTAFMSAVANAYPSSCVLQWWLALVNSDDSARSHNKPDFNMRYRGTAANVIFMAMRRNNGDLGSLLRDYKRDPTETRVRLRQQLGIKDTLPTELAADVFAQVIFLCDGLMCYGNVTGLLANKTVRFFKMTSQLPIELQMLICNRVAGLADNNILFNLSELAFRRLVRSLQC